MSNPQPPKAPAAPGPYQIVGDDAVVAPSGPTAFAGAGDPDEIASFVAKHTPDVAATSGKAPTDAGDDKPRKRAALAMEKVAAFLDVKAHGPLTLRSVRGKVFALRIPTQQEILDVQAIMGDVVDQRLTDVQTRWAMVGELKKAVVGWLPETSPAVQTLRAEMTDPTKWPQLRKVSWTDSRDPYIFEAEVDPLFAMYVEWRAEVVPTREEIDFFLASQG